MWHWADFESADVFGKLQQLEAELATRTLTPEIALKALTSLHAELSASAGHGRAAYARYAAVIEKIKHHLPEVYTQLGLPAQSAGASQVEVVEVEEEAPETETDSEEPEYEGIEHLESEEGEEGESAEGEHPHAEMEADLVEEVEVETEATPELESTTVVVETAAANEPPAEAEAVLIEETQPPESEAKPAEPPAAESQAEAIADTPSEAEATTTEAAETLEEISPQDLAEVMSAMYEGMSGGESEAGGEAASE